MSYVKYIVWLIYILKYNEAYLHVNYGIRKDMYDAYDLDEYGVNIYCNLIYDGEPEEAPLSEQVGSIQGVDIYRDTAPVCERELGQVTIDGFNFGYISEGCEYSINSIGYVAYTSEKVYSLEDVIISNKITVEDIYNLYMSDSDRKGSLD